MPGNFIADGAPNRTLIFEKSFPNFTRSITEASMNWLKWFFEWQYWFSKPPWDSGITPPEVVAFVEKNPARGRALDLGCGTGTNSIFLADIGFHVVGVDFSPKAIATAQAKARPTDVAVEFHVADVTQLDFLVEPFDYVLDIGCFHAVPLETRERYARGVARLTNPGGTFMLYAFSPRPSDQSRRLFAMRNVGITPEEVKELFARDFELSRVEHSTERGERASAWYWFVRKQNS
jgi:SAM-dependent methyltransferase